MSADGQSHRVDVTGRLCLFGEHSDWAAEHRSAMPDGAERPPGLCLVAGTDQGIAAEARALAGAVELSTRLPDGSTVGPLRCSAEVPELDRAARGDGFFRYALGAAAELIERHGAGGLRIDLDGRELPIGRGLSSSAAVCVAVVRAFARVHGLALSVDEEMDIAYAGERRTGSMCGRMDPVCAYGRRTTLLTIEADGLTVEPLEVAGTLHLLVVDLGRDKDTVRILADLNACFPDAPGEVARRVRDALGPSNAALVARARAALEAADAVELGALMDEAQARFDRDVVPASRALAAPALARVRAHPALAELAHGSKGVGSQGDGCAQILARGSEERDELARRLARDLRLSSLPLTLEPAAQPRTKR